MSADSDLAVYSFVWRTVYAIDLDSWLTRRQMGRMIHDDVYLRLVFIPTVFGVCNRMGYSQCSAVMLPDF